MGAINLEKPVPAVATLAGLVLVPNALGACARGFPILLRSVSSWIYPAARIQLYSILAVVLVFVFVFVLYLFLTRNRRARAETAVRRPLRDSSRRFLPPFEILLLQLGNLSFLVFAFVLLVLGCWLLFSILRAAVDSPWLATHGLGLGLAIALAGMALTLRRGVLATLSFDQLIHRWLPWSTLCALALAAFGLIAAGGGWGPLRIHVAASHLGMTTLGLLYGCLVVCLGLAQLVTRVGRARVSTARSRRPLALFVPGFLLAGIATCGLSALLLHAVFLTLHGHLGEL